MSSIDAPSYNWESLSKLSGAELSWLLQTNPLFKATYDVKYAAAKRNIRSYSNFTWTAEDSYIWDIEQKLNDFRFCPQ